MKGSAQKIPSIKGCFPMSAVRTKLLDENIKTFFNVRLRFCSMND